MPNLNVIYETVSLVYWDNDSCSAKLDPDPSLTTPAFPTTVLFDLESTANEPALTFYSRSHIQTVKIPEIADSIAAMERTVEHVRNKEVICCAVPLIGSCEGIDTDNTSLRKCNAEDLEYENGGLALLEASLNSWNKTLNDADTSVNDAINNMNSIVDWLTDDNVGRSEMHNDEYNTGNNIGDEMENFNVNLAPDQLIDDARITAEGLELLQVTNEEEAKDKIKKTKRIQFSGASGTYELSLDKTRYYNSASQDCTQSLPAGLAIGGVGAVGAIATATAASGGLALAVLPVIAGALVVSSAIAGCNFEIDPEIALGDTQMTTQVAGVGVAGSIGAGK